MSVIELALNCKDLSALRLSWVRGETSVIELSPVLGCRYRGSGE